MIAEEGWNATLRETGSRKRICIDLTPFEMFDRHGGVARYGAHLVRELMVRLESDPSSAELVVMTHTDAPPVSPEEALAWAADPGPEVELERHNHQRENVMGRMLSEARVDLFHSLHPNHVPLGAVPITLATCHDLIPLAFPPAGVGRMRMWRRRKRVRERFRHFDHVIADSAATGSDLRRLLRFRKSDTTIVHLGVDAEFFCAQPPAGEEDVRARLPDRYVVSVGSDYYRKNQFRLTEAWCRVAEQIPEDLVLVGRALYDDTFERIEAYAKERGLAARLHWLNDIEDAAMPGIYRRARAAVAPSLYEGFGMTLLEAMACGAPVVCCDNAAYAEVAGDAAIYFDGVSVDAIAARLVEISRDDELRETLVTRGHARAAKLSWRNTADQTWAVYERLLGV